MYTSLDALLNDLWINAYRYWLNQLYSHMLMKEFPLDILHLHLLISIIYQVYLKNRYSQNILLNVIPLLMKMLKRFYIKKWKSWSAICLYNNAFSLLKYAGIPGGFSQFLSWIGWSHCWGHVWSTCSKKIILINLHNILSTLNLLFMHGWKWTSFLKKKNEGQKQVFWATVYGWNR